MICLGNTTRNAGKGVGISAESYRFPDGILIVLGLKKTDQGLQNRSLAGFVPLIVAIPVGISLMQVIAKALLNIVPDLLF